MRNSFPQKIIRKVVYNYHEGGLKAIIYKIAKTLSCKIYDREKIIIFKSDLKNIPQMELKLDVKALSFHELCNLGYFKALFFPEAIQERLGEGQKCFGFFIGEELASVTWVTHGKLKLTYNFPCIDIQNGAGIYDSYTFPAFRRRGVYTASNICLQNIFLQQGKDNVLVAVHPDNIYSKNGLQKSGFRYLYSLNFQRKFFSSSVWKT